MLIIMYFKLNKVWLYNVWISKLVQKNIHSKYHIMKIQIIANILHNAVQHVKMVLMANTDINYLLH